MNKFRPRPPRMSGERKNKMIKEYFLVSKTNLFLTSLAGLIFTLIGIARILFYKDNFSGMIFLFFGFGITLVVLEIELQSIKKKMNIK